MRTFFVSIGIGAALLCAAVASGSPASPTAVSTLRADVGEWSVVPSVGVVEAGRVHLQVRNLGSAVHEIVLVRTRDFAQRLPVRGSRALLRPLAGALRVRPGERASLVVDLRRGSYELVDDLPWAYWKGTSAAFSVR